MVVIEIASTVNMAVNADARACPDFLEISTADRHVRAALNAISAMPGIHGAFPKIRIAAAPQTIVLGPVPNAGWNSEP